MPGKWKEPQTWPENHRRCLTCCEIKPYEEFHKHKACYGGVNSICKSCRVSRSQLEWNLKPEEHKIFNRAKTRATKKKLEFTIELSDIIIPEICPVFKTKLKTPSIDRIDSSRGYGKGNIRIIENRANMLKNNATVDELKLILADITK